MSNRSIVQSILLSINCCFQCPEREGFGHFWPFSINYCTANLPISVTVCNILTTIVESIFNDRYKLSYQLCKKTIVQLSLKKKSCVINFGLQSARAWVYSLSSIIFIFLLWIGQNLQQDVKELRDILQLQITWSQWQPKQSKKTLFVTLRLPWIIFFDVLWSHTKGPISSTIP